MEAKLIVPGRGEPGLYHTHSRLLRRKVEEKPTATRKEPQDDPKAAGTAVTQDVQLSSLSFLLVN